MPKEQYQVSRLKSGGDVRDLLAEVKSSIYVCGDGKIFSSIDATLLYVDRFGGTALEYRPDGNEFKPTGFSVSWLRCENCNKRWRSDTAPSFGEQDCCSPECAKEVEDFYAAGGIGIFGQSVREVKEHIRKCSEAGHDPYAECAGRTA